MIRTLRTTAGRLYRDFMLPIHYRQSRAELLRSLPTDFSAAALWNVCQSYRGQGWFKDLSAWQVQTEYCSMIDWVQSKKPRIILEIGTAKGATLLAWSRIASELVVSVDLPGGIHGGGYVVHKERLFRDFVSGRPGVEIELFRGDSHSAETRDRVKHMLRGRPIDFLFIDGDHTYAGVSRDFELWIPLVARGGYVAFHDILPHKELKDCEVDRLWRELKPRHRTIEFVADPDQGWAGIGILKLS